MKLTLYKKTQEDENAYSFFFKPDPPFSWRAGQYLRYHIDDPAPDDRGENHFFSIASAPNEQQVRLTTRFVPEGGSTFKKDLQKINVGDSIQATGPLGAFVVDDPSKEYVFIAGGIGITPFRSILIDLDQKSLPINITLLYANRTENVIYKNELEKLKEKNPNFKIHYFIGEVKIDENAIRTLVPDLNKPFFYISGPEPMVKSFEELLAKMGVPTEHIKRDSFPGYTQI